MSLEWSAHAYSSCFELSDINEYPRRPHPFLKFYTGNFGVVILSHLDFLFKMCTGMMPLLSVRVKWKHFDFFNNMK